MSLKKEFLELATLNDSNISELCRHFGISRKTGYKWLRRFHENGMANVVDRSRRPHYSPRRKSPEIESLIIKVRLDNPAWGGRKIKRYLDNNADGHIPIPCPSTITEILRRNNLIDEQEAEKHRPFQRFEMERPNKLWQMDFKGFIQMKEGGYCHPLTILDDHSRFLIGLRACPNQVRKTVKEHLTSVFRIYGLPERMLMDHGKPWGFSEDYPYTVLTAWLIRLGIEVSHGRPHHPQTQGKAERFHRTLENELISRHSMNNLSECQQYFDEWRDLYNIVRPHEALQMKSPIDIYRPSSISFPEVLPPIIYDPEDMVRKVDGSGKIYFRNRIFRISKAFCHNPVALRVNPDQDGYFDVFFCSQKVAQLSLKEDNC